MSKRGSKVHWSGYTKKNFAELVDEEQTNFFSDVPQSSSAIEPNSVCFDASEQVDPSIETQLSASSENIWDDLLSEFEKSFEDNHPMECSGSNTSELPMSNTKNDLASDLAGFAVKKGRPINDTTELLHILNKHKIKDLPKTRNTLLKAPAEKITQRQVAGGGSFYYRGIRKCLEVRKHLLTSLDVIELDVGIDGARAFKSSILDLWPCIGALADLVHIRPFLLGCYQGQGKAKNSEEFFDEFEKELLELYRNGIEFVIGESRICKPVRIRLFMLDSPARADICKIMSYSSYQGCPLCKFTERVAGQKKEHGESEHEWKGKVVYSNRVGFSPRTDETFRDRIHPEHHKPEFRTKRSVLEDLGFRMITQFPLDPMHIIDLGAVFKGLDFLVKAQNTPSLMIDIDKLSERMLAFGRFRPSDFARDIRSLKDLQHFKATELRQFLMYGGIVFMKDLVANHIYDHWLLLHVAVRLLSAENLTGHNIDTAEQLIDKYVEQYPSIYGADSVTYVIHVLLHITYYSRQYGALDSFSCYKFENFIQKLKGYLGNAFNPLQQIRNRIDEEEMHNPESFTVPNFNKMEIKCDERDSFIALKMDGQIRPFQVISIYDQNSEKYLGVRRCLNIQNFYTTPIVSSTIGEITYDGLSFTIEHYKSSEIIYKYCRLLQQHHKMLKNSLHSLLPIPVNSQPNSIHKKPILVTLTKSGNNIIFAKQTVTDPGISKIPKLYTSDFKKLNGLDLKDEKKGMLGGVKVTRIESSQINCFRNVNDGRTKAVTYTNQIKTQLQSQDGHSKSYTPVGINFIHKEKKLMKPLTVNKGNSSLNTHHYSTVAPESKAISKQKPAKRSYKKQQPNEACEIPKYNFPLPPPKIDFSVSTNTIFNTAVDVDESAHGQKPNSPAVSHTSMAPFRDGTIIDHSNGVPDNCPSFKKILVDTSKLKRTEVLGLPRVATAPNAPINRKEPIGSQARGDDSIGDDSICFSAAAISTLSEFHANSLVDPAPEKVVDTLPEHFECGEVMKQLKHMEALQLASSKREAQMLVALKKLCLQYTKHNNDNDEIKKLLPIKKEIQLIEMDTRIIEDPIFKEKLIAYIRGFKTTDNPDNFAAYFNVLLSDELVVQFNLKGIMGKKKLEGFKIMEIIRDLHKPMDNKTFDKLMRLTIELAKNRYHNEQYRKRQQQKGPSKEPSFPDDDVMFDAE